MTDTEKNKKVELGVMQAHTKTLFNKGIGNEGICSTEADVAAKEVILGTTFELVPKATIIVTFTNEIAVANATLTVTHTDLDGNQTVEDAKPIKYRGTALGANLVRAGLIVLMRYDGTAWNIIGGLDQDLSGKQDVISDLSAIRSGASAGSTAYQKPSGGIPMVDMEASVQQSLGKAESALQDHQDISGKADKTATVSDITYDSATGKLKKTINGTTTDVCDVVQSGFVPTFNPTTGLVDMAPVGGATIAPNSTTGLIEMNF